jgi:stringent starvation protein B
MTSLISTKPYLVRAIHEWCVDNYLTPLLMVAISPQTVVPMAYVKNGEIVLNLSYTATKDLLIENNQITFSARFGGISHDIFIPMIAVKGIFARENNQGMYFQPEEISIGRENAKKTLNPIENSDKNDTQLPSAGKNHKKPTLKVVK